MLRASFVPGSWDGMRCTVGTVGGGLLSHCHAEALTLPAVLGRLAGQEKSGLPKSKAAVRSPVTARRHCAAQTAGAAGGGDRSDAAARGAKEARRRANAPARCWGR